MDNTLVTVLGHRCNYRLLPYRLHMRTDAGKDAGKAVERGTGSCTILNRKLHMKQGAGRWTAC